MRLQKKKHKNIITVLFCTAFKMSNGVKNIRSLKSLTLSHCREPQKPMKRLKKGNAHIINSKKYILFPIKGKIK